MASPDFRQYVDLTIFDKQPRDIYQESVEYAQVAVPELVVRAGTVEDALFQAMSFISGETIASVNRLPNGLMEGILNLLGFSRINATYATGTVEFTMLDTQGAILPAGTQIGYTDTVEGTSTFHTFSTTAEVIVASGSSTASSVPFIADEPGEKPALSTGQSMVVVSASNRILSAELDSNLSQGQEAESDIEYFARGATYLASLSNCLTTAEQIRNYILSNYNDVDRCLIYDLTKLETLTPTSLVRTSGTVTASFGSDHGISTGDLVRIYGADTGFDGDFEATALSTTKLTWTQSGADETATDPGTLYNFQSTIGDTTGHITIFMSDSLGNPISDTLLTEIIDDISEKTVAGLTVTATHPILVPVEVSIEIDTREGYSPLAIGDAVDQYVTDLMSPNTWDGDTTWRINYVVARVSQLTGVNYVSDLSFNNVAAVYGTNVAFGPDVSMTYKGSLPVATVTVSEET